MNVQVLGDDVGPEPYGFGDDSQGLDGIAAAMRVRNVTAVRKPSFLSRSKVRQAAQRLVTNPQYKSPEPYRGFPEYRTIPYKPPEHYGTIPYKPPEHYGTIPYKPPEPYGFGDDSQGLDGEGWNTFFKILRKAAPIVAPIIINRLTPSQKAELQAVTGTSTSIGNPPPEKSFMEKYGVYVAIGGALVIGSIVMVKTRRRPSPAAA